jgi:pimeloyl-ACP methyl ester carboxylesterase
MTNLLLLHGAIGCSVQMKALQQLLSRDYGVHTLNFPGHGGKELPDQFSIPLFARSVREYCRDHHLEKVSIFGYSMGGFVGLYLALHHPELVDRVITLATKFHWDEATAEREVRMLQPQVIEERLPQFALQLQERHRPQDWKVVLQKTASMLTAMGKEHPLPPESYARISTPCLLMVGDRDKMVSFEETVGVYKQLPQAQLAVLPCTPHPIEHMDTYLLAQMVNRFLQPDKKPW